MAAGSFNFIGKQDEDPNKNRDFLNFRYSDPLRDENGLQRTANRYYLLPNMKPWLDGPETIELRYLGV